MFPYHRGDLLVLMVLTSAAAPFGQKHGILQFSFRGISLASSKALRSGSLVYLPRLKGDRIHLETTTKFPTGGPAQGEAERRYTVMSKMDSVALVVT